MKQKMNREEPKKQWQMAVTSFHMFLAFVQIKQIVLSPNSRKSVR